MPTKQWSAGAKDMDYVGNNAAFTCPACGRVFLVSAAIHPTPDGQQGHDGRRKCPWCSKSEGHVAGGAKSGGAAWIDY